MDKRLQKIVDNYDYENWEKTLNGYLRDPYSKGEISQEEAVNQIYGVVGILSELAKACISYGNFKDAFEYDKFYQHYYGPELIINSGKTKTVYYIGFNDKRLYIRTYLKHNFSLKNMDDNFWISLLSLYNYGKFELVENEHLGKEIRKKYPELFNNQKGTVFRLFRKYFVSFLIEEDKDYREDVIGSLGDLQITWNSNYGLDKIVEECCEAFKILYKLNYDLWKIEDVKIKSEKSSR